MSVLGTDWGTVQLLVLGVGLATGAAWDLWRREVPDRLWVGMAVIGAGIGLILVWGAGPTPVVLWLLVAAFAVQQILPWEMPLESNHPSFAFALDVGLYGVVGAILLAFSLALGVGPSAVPLSAIAVYVGVLLARALFEAGWLFGGADAKALIVSAIVLPTFATPILGVGGRPGLLEASPFAFTMLLNAVIASLAVPAALGILNARRGTFRFPQGFLGYSIPVDELARRWVWVRDPREPGAAEEEGAIRDSEADRRRRERQAADLRSRGVEQVWVYPQVPFVAFLALGAGLALLFGNAVFDLVSLL